MWIVSKCQILAPSSGSIIKLACTSLLDPGVKVIAISAYMRDVCLVTGNSTQVSVKTAVWKFIRTHWKKCISKTYYILYLCSYVQERRWEKKERNKNKVINHLQKGFIMNNNNVIAESSMSYTSNPSFLLIIITCNQLLDAFPPTTGLLLHSRLWGTVGYTKVLW